MSESSVESGEVLRRIEERLEAFQEHVDRRLTALERKVEEAALPPRAVKRDEAGRLLGWGKTKLKEAIRDGRIHACEGSPETIPMSEIIRLTAVRSPESYGAPMAQRRRSTKRHNAAEEAEKILAAIRERKKKR